MKGKENPELAKKKMQQAEDRTYRGLAGREEVLRPQ